MVLSQMTTNYEENSGCAWFDRVPSCFMLWDGYRLADSIVTHPCRAALSVSYTASACSADHKWLGWACGWSSQPSSSVQPQPAAPANLKPMMSIWKFTEHLRGTPTETLFGWLNPYFSHFTQIFISSRASIWVTKMRGWLNFISHPLNLVTLYLGYQK